MGNKRFPRGWWNDKEHCREYASLCHSRKEFNKRFGSVYQACQRNGWLDELCPIPDTGQFPQHYWTKEKVLETVSKYDSLTDFTVKEYKAYRAAIRLGMLDEITVNIRKHQPLYTWTNIDNLKKEALKYNSIIDFMKGNAPAYAQARRLGVLKDVCAHMERLHKEHNYWDNLDHCIEAAMQCKTVSEFSKKFNRAYTVIRKNGWMKYIPLKTRGNTFKRGIYAVEFDDKCVYVGLTNNFSYRERCHYEREKSAVYKHIMATGLKPTFKIIYDYTDALEARELEGKVLDDYISKGWTKLNVSKTGGLGNTGLELVKTILKQKK